MNKNTNFFDTKKLVGIAMFAALAYCVAYFCSFIPEVAGFLSLDAKDAVIAIASFIYGPVAGVLISFVAAFIEFLTFGSATAWYGFIMNFASSAVFSVTASFIYRKWRNTNGALLAFLSAISATVAVMLLLNIFVTPIYLVKFYAMPENIATQTVMDMLATTLIPFNAAKSLLNSAVAMMLYKPITTAMRRAGLLKGQGKMQINRAFVLVYVTAIITLAVAVIILIIIK